MHTALLQARIIARAEAIRRRCDATYSRIAASRRWLDAERFGNIADMHAGLDPSGGLETHIERRGVAAKNPSVDPADPTLLSIAAR